MKPYLPAIALIGPTGVGKTALSLALAQRFDCEIVSVDSMQVFRHMDIGTAKASPEERALVPHHLLDVANPDEEYSVARFIADAAAAMAAIRARGRRVLLVGGTGLYLRGLEQGLFVMPASDGAVREELRQRLEGEGAQALHGELGQSDPESAARIHPNDTCRLLRALEILRLTGTPWSVHLARGRQEAVLSQVLKVGLTCPREELYQRINRRVTLMAEAGLLDEVRGLLAMGYGPELKAMQAIGYRHMMDYIRGEHDWQESLSLLARDTRRYAKRQYTWFRSDPAIHWFEPGRQGEIVALIEGCPDAGSCDRGAGQ